MDANTKLVLIALGREDLVSTIEAAEGAVVHETPTERANRNARPGSTPKAKNTTRASSGPKAATARTRKPATEGVWTCRQAWKGQEPTGGLLWAARKAGVAAATIAKADKFELSQAIGKARGLKVEVIA